ncbi:unnamed protein product [Lasius platythorax]|uniref:Uncharacterized protein n=1 Tax=Lasius platythorax TaxID=488582 RepID=A0AAV2PCZ4_9HYME
MRSGLLCTPGIRSNAGIQASASERRSTSSQECVELRDGLGERLSQRFLVARVSGTTSLPCAAFRNIFNCCTDATTRRCAVLTARRNQVLSSSTTVADRLSSI